MNNKIAKKIHMVGGSVGIIALGFSALVVNKVCLEGIFGDSIPVKIATYAGSIGLGILTADAMYGYFDKVEDEVL